MSKTIGGFGLVKNAIKYGYPVVESINSLLPYLDEFILNVGISEDNTEALIEKEFGNHPKVFYFRSKWEDFRKGTAFFSNQSNMALELVSSQYAFFLQADEAINEKDGKRLQSWIERCEAENLQGVTFKYNHFVKDSKHVYKTYKDGGDFYDSEIRLFKNDNRLVSFGDAQSFCFLEDRNDPRGPQPALHRPERFLDSNMEIFHYGYLKDSAKILEKKKYLSKFYDISEPSRKEKIPEKDGKYLIDESKIKEWNGVHPNSMKSYLENYES